MEGQHSPESVRRRRPAPASTDSHKRHSLMRQACINSARASLELRSDPPAPPPPPPQTFSRGNTSNSSFERLLNGGAVPATGLRRSSSLPRQLSALDGGAARRSVGGAAYRSHFLLREEHRALLRPAQQALQRHRSRQLDSLLDSAGWRPGRASAETPTESEDGIQLRSVVRFDDEPRPAAEGGRAHGQREGLWSRARPRSMEVTLTGYRSKSLDVPDGVSLSKIPG
ncbi:hypothetical protein FJT64_001757 [Amphibalanus amphitrite]|uniref:Uncharacterized protein n=1 Tax=Amphibalanus amphitrite TaxID=1232801 RepID=A0A6A4XC43_AMPAM|nr:hypothetical protein FJT64_001757 [Amphibalanus amphitrite]